jgi:hypothetical protein
VTCLHTNRPGHILTTLYMPVCACVRVRACGYPGTWACACACEHVALLIQHSTCMRHIVTSFVVAQSPPCFSTLSHKRGDFRKKKLLSIKCFDFLYNFCLKHFPI